ncbi:helix-turn-helix transcriptional regulator [Streptomyces sasae]|uniref:helix-turn-helix transcriptional regulator n=1 Tax=Streptomyces sasae TaxID=1266772 RepID=UPI00292D8031|nr:LuxR family transcriptional regulator [Streptomyces sasae]
MSRGRGVIGRHEELAAVGALLGKPVPIVVRGPRGVGKTALLDEVASGCRDRGIRTITVELTSDESWDLFGAQAVLKALRAGFSDIGGSRPATALATVNQLCTPATYDSPASRVRLLHQLQRLFDSLHGPTPAVVLLDDADAAPATVITTASVALRAGCTVVVACDDEGVALELTAFGEAAGQVVELGPLGDQRVGELVAAATRHQSDPAVTPAIQAALGSLAGNPGAVLALCGLLMSQGRLTPLGGALCLADPDAPIALPAGHWLVRLVERTHAFGLRLLALIADSEWFGMDDLAVFAAAVDAELGACGRAVDEFTAVGALRCTPDGVLTLACPALGAAAIDAVGADRLRALHLAFAQHLVLRDPSVGHMLLPLADQLAAAGSVDVGDIDAATLLERAARRILPVNPPLAARWRRAALAHCAAADRARLLDDLLRELVRIGRYDWLGEVLAEAGGTCGEAAPDATHPAAYDALTATTKVTAASGTPTAGAKGATTSGTLTADTTTATTPGTLTAAVCLAALHRGTALPAGVGGVPAASVVDRWFGGNKPFGAEELAYALAPLGGTHAPPAAPQPDGWFDPIGMFKAVLGPAYGAPERGPLVLYRRIVDGYRRGQWDDALSDARTLVATYPAATPVHELARLLAAEMCRRRDELDLAESWLDEPDRRGAFPTVRSWVEMGLLEHRGQVDAALACGRRACRTAVRAAEAGDTAGLQLLIIRHAFLATACGGGEGLVEIQEAARAWRGHCDRPEPGVTELLMTAMVQNSFPAASAAAAALRGRGHRTELATACLIAARTADDTRPWLGTADEIAEQLGDTRLRTYIKTLARTRGVTLPRRTTSSRAGAEVEARIIELILQGMTNRQIAAAIRFSEKSVERHLTRLFAKTGCRSRLDLVAAYERGMLACT